MIQTPTSLQTPKSSPTCNRFVNLLPNFSWANSKDVWSNLIAKEQFHTRNPLMMSRHPNLQPRMRSILLNWLSEVSEVYQLHRETYYLALDYFDRYLSVQNDINKQQLQLVGITCLFIAAKIEEIYPPKVSDFAYVTDGACTEKEILHKELVILKSLKWNLNSMTANSWLTIYMQLYTIYEKERNKLIANNSSSSIKDQSSKERLSPSKHQPPKKRKRTALSNSNSPSQALQEADTNKQVVPINQDGQQLTKLNKKEIDAKVDSDDEKQSINSNSSNLNKINSKSNEEVKKDEKSKSFISSNLKSNRNQEEDEFMYQKYDSYFYAQIAHLVDLSMLDILSLRFSYNVISASALYHFTNMNIVLQCTGKFILYIFYLFLFLLDFY